MRIDRFGTRGICHSGHYGQRRGPPSESAADASLVRRVAEGDQQAAAQLVAKYSPLIAAVTNEYKMTVFETAAVAEKTWGGLVENINRLEHPERVGSWLIATARNECLRVVAVR